MASIDRDIVIWDPVIRIFHWSTALLFTLNMTVLEDKPHEYAGYILAGLVGTRIIWGFIGPRRARFRSFWPSRQRIKDHLCDLAAGKSNPTEGHNPLGGLMVLALLAALLLTALTGWMQSWSLFWGQEWLETLHEVIANTALCMVALHVSAILLMQKLTRLELIRPMLTGKRRVSSNA